LFNLGESQQKRVAKPPTHVDEEPEKTTFITNDVCLSASYGIASSNEGPTKTADAVYRIADERMYKMKALSKANS